MNYRIRPITVWPGELTPATARKTSPFSSNYSATKDLLTRELKFLNIGEAVIELAITEGDIRLDGQLRANCRPEHPGVILSFTSRDHGSLRYHCDRFSSPFGRWDDWQQNLRAIALGLEALRKVDRFGIAGDGEQYTGWKALTAAAEDEPMTVDVAARFLAAMEGADPHARGAVLLANPDEVVYAWRVVAKRLHPDRGGDPALFRQATEAKRLLDEHHAGTR